MPNVGENVEKLPAWLIHNMENLTSLTLPKRVKSVEENAIGNCNNLTNISSLSLIPPKAANGAFENLCVTDITLYVPTESVEDYKSANEWKNFGMILPLEAAGVDNILISGNNQSSIKFLRNGQLIIIRHGETYNAMGQEL